jgi:hypothetical protein
LERTETGHAIRMEKQKELDGRNGRQADQKNKIQNPRRGKGRTSRENRLQNLEGSGKTQQKHEDGIGSSQCERNRFRKRKKT